MKSLTQSQFETLTREGQVIIAKPSGEAMVVQTPDDFIIKKLPFRKDLLSLLYPRARRFRRNSRNLISLGFETVQVKDIFSFPERNCHVIVYRMVRGQALAEHLATERNTAARHDILRRIAVFYGRLHDQGVYCRPTHFRNIIICPDSDFALIDVQNIRFRILSLDLWTRSRSFKYIFKYNSDMQHIVSFGAKEFFDIYMSHCRMGDWSRSLFPVFLRRNIPGLFKKNSREFLS